MSLKFQILGSSSSGNCSLLETESGRILIDAGFSGKRICEMLEARGMGIEAIDAVFITHEHSDHIAGVRGLSRFRHLEFYANLQTARAVQSRLREGRDLNWRLFETGTRFRFRDVEVAAFAVPHDAYDPVGFVFQTGRGDLFSPVCSLAWMTDLGHVPSAIAPLVRGADILVIEANHDLDMLENNPKRPFSTKQRIRSRHGHLSNEDARAFVNGTAEARWRHVCLAHLSRDCNTVERVREVFDPHHLARPLSLSIVDPDGKAGEIIDLSV